MSSPTRLVVLGAVHQFQPVHGYFLRRELMTWLVDEWANIQPGSIYNALRSLEQDGYVRESGTESDGKRPARTSYTITPAGEVELMRMLRDTLWNVEPFDTQAVMVIASFMFILSRQEVIAGLEHRITKIDAIVLTNGFHIEDTARSETTPKYVREIFELSTARLKAEQEWARSLVERLRQGEYSFADDPREEQPRR
ncbi:helix-turn-helix transcriptional regulator [Agromyces mediolanus]|uniref:PadR family transcriptional regulator n=1 Tax=Agromyces mediolanus TaxID=41986 RepID=UPI00383537AD